jgi:type IV pilus assembly protein PilV
MDLPHITPIEHPRAKHKTLPCRRDPQHGFSLLEVLISIIILSFGLLGMVGLQAAALQANRDARVQSSALGLARELAEMMRGNKDIALLTSDNPYLGDFSSSPLTAASPSYCLNVASAAPSCASTTDIANAQVTEWLARVDAELPAARVVVCNDSQPFVDGMPTWTCTTTGNVTTVIKIGWTRGSTDRSKTGDNAFDRATGEGSVPTIVIPVTPGIAS